MKAVVLGALIGAGLVIATVGALDDRGEARAQQMPPSRGAVAGSELIVVPAPATETAQLLVVVDPRLRAMSVYQIDLVTGKIALRSVRNIHWDLQVMQLNNENPLPQEIRALLEQR